MHSLAAILAFMTSVSPLLAVVPAPQEPPQDPPRVLFLTHSAGFTHPVVRRAAQAKLAYAETTLIEAAGDRLAITATQDCAAISAENLAGFDAVLFYTTGELPIPESDQAALLDWIRA
ncbi:MAG: hypothetical protein AAGG01_21275, partial [Planctomycetota bacterium]